MPAGPGEAPPGPGSGPSRRPQAEGGVPRRARPAAPGPRRRRRAALARSRRPARPRGPASAAVRGAHHQRHRLLFLPPAGGAEARCRSWWLCGAPGGWRRARRGRAAAAPPRREAARGPCRRVASRAAGVRCPPSVAPSCLKGRRAAREGGSCVPGPARVRRAASMPAGLGGGSPRSPAGPAECPGAWPAGPPRLRRAASTAGEERRRRHDSRVKRVLFLPCLLSSTHEVTPYAQKYGVHPRFFVFEKNGDKRLTDSGIKEDIKRIEQGLGPLKLGRRHAS
ncbi:unnamed protein product [Prorocentrum cordatum]|uniref:Uncharacterized protein n=1 Tax=Prorocentrum cordatum TaxID=2364126 RepID=A0ABN9YHG8_9DINO|nr:unnamed protein product [Polarella glacialis]